MIKPSVLLLAATFSIAGLCSASDAFASDLEGAWQGEKSSLIYFTTQPGDFENSIDVEGCHLRAAVNLPEGRFELSELSAECQNPQLIFKAAFPVISFTVDENGWLYDEAGPAGRIFGNTVDFDFSDDQGGVHTVHLEATEDGLRAQWKFDGWGSPSFDLSSMNHPLKRTR